MSESRQDFVIRETNELALVAWPESIQHLLKGPALDEFDVVICRSLRR